MKVPTSWDDALDLVARVTVAVIKEQGEDDFLFGLRPRRRRGRL